MTKWYTRQLKSRQISESNEYQLTYPEFQFETETRVDSLTGVQRYKGKVIMFVYDIDAYVAMRHMNIEVLYSFKLSWG